MSNITIRYYAGTGHRPKVLGLDYSEKSNQLLTKFCIQILNCLKEKYREDIVEIISGGAAGFDLAWAEAAIALDCPLTLAIPFYRFGENWPQEGKDRLNRIMNKALDVQYISKDTYKHGSQYIERDKWMVDNCHEVVALYSGLEKSGTGATVRYAESKGKSVTNIWAQWQEFFEKEK